MGTTINVILDNFNENNDHFTISENGVLRFENKTIKLNPRLLIIKVNFAHYTDSMPSMLRKKDFNSNIEEVSDFHVDDWDVAKKELSRLQENAKENTDYLLMWGIQEEKNKRILIENGLSLLTSGDIIAYPPRIKHAMPDTMVLDKSVEPSVTRFIPKKGIQVNLSFRLLQDNKKEVVVYEGEDTKGKHYDVSEKNTATLVEKFDVVNDIYNDHYKDKY
jgi:hypothetical protein